MMHGVHYVKTSFIFHLCLFMFAPCINNIKHFYYPTNALNYINRSFVKTNECLKYF
jgi:hypothetical protein